LAQRKETREMNTEMMRHTAALERALNESRRRMAVAHAMNAALSGLVVGLSALVLWMAVAR
jgi:hypothetical protein